MKKYILIICSTVIFFHCQQPANNSASIIKGEASDMAGTWYSEHLDYTIDFNTDSAINEVVSIEEFPEKYQMSGVMANYFDDSSFVSTYIGLEGEAIKTDYGTWYAVKDSLFIIYDTDEIEDTLKYAYSVEENIGTFETVLDWDADGYKDDLLILKSRVEK